MEQHSKPSPKPVSITEVATKDVPTRRNFLGGVGAVGFAAAMASMMDPSTAHATSMQTTSSLPRLSEVDNVKVLRDESYDVPGGKEHLVQYVATDEKGTSVRHSYSMTKINQAAAYTIAANFRVERFAQGQALTTTPAGVDTMDITVHGIQGDTFGNIRKDTVTTTIVGGDGSIHRETREVNVKLDLSEYEGLTTAELAQKMGNLHLER